MRKVVTSVFDAAAMLVFGVPILIIGAAFLAMPIVETDGIKVGTEGCSVSGV